MLGRPVTRRITGLAVGFVSVLSALLYGAAPVTRPARTLELQVVDSATHAPLAGVKVEYSRSGEEANAATGADGRCRIEYSPDVKFLSLSARAEGRVPVRVSWDLRRSKQAVPEQHTLSLEPGTKIGGRVVDDAGDPVEGATVMLHIRKQVSKSPDERVDVAYVPVKTGADGRWSFDQAPAEFDTIDLGTYHLKYATGAYYPMEKFTQVAKLRDASATLTLARGTPVEGVVYGSDGKPFAGASVGVGSDRVASNVTPEFKTDERGRFSFGAKPGEMVVITVKAKGHAPELKQFSAGTLQKKQEVEFRLQPAKTLRGRVVDATGKPLEGVSIFTDTWRGNRTLAERLKTDADGRFAWDSAPADAVLLDIYKLGYADLRNHSVTASDKEVTLTLRQPLKVRGTVVDAETGKPVDSFRVVQGITFDDKRISWQRRQGRPDGDGDAGKAGTFEQEQSYPYPGYAIRIEADGYLPADSRIYKLDEGQVELKFELKKGKSLIGVVRTAEGKPAAGAQVVVATPSQAAYIVNGKEVRDQGCVTTKTDEQGRYSLPPQVGSYTLVVLHDGGYAEAPAAQLATSQDVQLTAWGRVEGVVKVGSKPGVGSELRISHMEQKFDENAPRIHHQIETKSDAQGKFVFDRVQPGEVWVSRTISIPMGGGSWMSSSAQTATAIVEAGKVALVQVGGTGRPVVGRVNIPREVADRPALIFSTCSLNAKVEFPRIDIPDSVKEKGPEEVKKWHEEFMKSDKGKAYQEEAKKAQRASRFYAVVAQPDGKFRADDIPAGKYTLTIGISQPPADRSCGPGDVLATASAEVTVDEMPGGRSDEPLEVPTLEMKVRRTVGVGDAAPAFTAKTLDGKELKLEDLKGKYVLLDFWATWCGPCVAETPNMKAVYDAFGKDERFVMLALSLDDKPDAPRKYAQKNDLKWVQGFLGAWSQTKVPETYGIDGIPSIWLIGPDDKVIAKGLRGAGIKSAVEAALAAGK
jgi:5-hydroxyisourate hydrolase-like protein (transthyretin family)/peroxiredoxin